MSHEKAQHYFQNVVKIIAEACNKKVRKTFVMLDADRFESFYENFGQIAILENPQISDFIGLSFLLSDLERLAKKHEQHFQGLAQSINNANTIINLALKTHVLTKAYIDTVKQLSSFEQNASDKALSQLGFTFGTMVARFKKIHTPTWDLLEQFKTALQEYNKTPELKVYFDPIIAFLESVLPKKSQEIPTPDASLKISSAISQ